MSRLLPERLRVPLTWKKPRRVFVNSMSDVFHPAGTLRIRAQDGARHGGSCPRARSRVPGPDKEAGTRRWPGGNATRRSFLKAGLPTLWIGTSVESQKYAPRLTVLARIPAAVRFVSVEPLLERVDLSSVAGVRGNTLGDCWRARAAPRRVQWTSTGRETCAISRTGQEWRSSSSNLVGFAASAVAPSPSWMSSDGFRCRPQCRRVSSSSFGGPWTQEKLEILRRYLGCLYHCPEEPTVHPYLR